MPLMQESGGFKNTVGSGAGSGLTTQGTRNYLSCGPTTSQLLQVAGQEEIYSLPCAPPSTFANGESLHMESNQAVKI
uniref:Uncharacterized protein n=1 Tax=Arundo donax TaxID=35708 RepID=A0A0A9GVJ3_ARUDO